MNASMRRTHALSALALAPVAFALPKGAGAQAIEHLKLAGPQTEDLTAVYYGIKSGLFSRAGLEVEMVGTSSGTAAVTAMIAGTYELAKTSLLSVFNAHLKAIPIAIVAPEFTYNARSPFGLLQIATDSPFKTGDRSQRQNDRGPRAQRPQHARARAPGSTRTAATGSR